MRARILEDREQGEEMDVFASLETAVKIASSYQKQSGDSGNPSASEKLAQNSPNSPSVGGGCQGRPLTRSAPIHRCCPKFP